mmetsp:Transcript_13667/g.38799  ORF Transcript_13667/g.38799 Transcript_13667/m.38799 type:complete len:287 (+) Transcript_13667:486-1346(+)
MKSWTTPRQFATRRGPRSTLPSTRLCTFRNSPTRGWSSATNSVFARNQSADQRPRKGPDKWRSSGTTTTRTSLRLTFHLGPSSGSCRSTTTCLLLSAGTSSTSLAPSPVARAATWPSTFKALQLDRLTRCSTVALSMSGARGPATCETPTTSFLRSIAPCFSTRHSPCAQVARMSNLFECSRPSKQARSQSLRSTVLTTTPDVRTLFNRSWIRALLLWYFMIGKNFQPSFLSWPPSRACWIRCSATCMRGRCDTGRGCENSSSVLSSADTTRWARLTSSSCPANAL